MIVPEDGDREEFPCDENNSQHSQLLLCCVVTVEWRFADEEPKLISFAERSL